RRADGRTQNGGSTPQGRLNLSIFLRTNLSRRRTKLRWLHRRKSLRWQRMSAVSKLSPLSSASHARQKTVGLPSRQLDEPSLGQAREDRIATQGSAVTLLYPRNGRLLRPTA